MLVPDEIEPRVGWRTWRLAPTGRLHSLNRIVWVPGQPLHAKCTRNRHHQAPDEHCTCGIYAGDSLEHLMELGYATARKVVIGSVSMWGVVIVADHGFRAECAYPRKLYVPPLEWRQAKRLEETYGVPATIIQRRQ